MEPFTFLRRSNVNPLIFELRLLCRLCSSLFYSLILLSSTVNSNKQLVCVADDPILSISLNREQNLAKEGIAQCQNI